MNGITKDKMENIFDESIDTKERSKILLPEMIHASEIIMEKIKAGNKILACGNGGSAGDAQHFVSELVNRFEKERQELSAVSLATDINTISAIGNDYGFEHIFAKQLKALGKSGDILLAISTSGNSQNVINAINIAHEKKITVIMLSGKSGGKMREIKQKEDIELCVPSDVTARIQEVHLLIIHSLCSYIDSFY